MSIDAEAPSQEEPQANSAPAPASKPRRRRASLVAAVCFLILLTFLWYIGVLGGNVRIVDAGRVYRSSQLTGNGYDGVSARMFGNSLDSVLDRYQIHTVLNLRGGSDKDLYYRQEVAICAKDQVDHVDVPISARHLPSPESLHKILDTFDHARYPVIIHCQAGSDRTGLVSALYVALYRKVPVEQATLEELTWHYGHFSATKTHVMDEFFDLYEKDRSGLDLRTWIEQKYPQIYAASPDK